MPALMQSAPAAPKGPGDAADDFFGESDALAAGMTPAAAIGPGPGAFPGHVPNGPAPQGYGPPAMYAGGQPAGELVPAGVPAKGPSLLLLLFVGGGALLLGAVVVVLFLLLG
jgi:hypothetical protein